MNRLAWIVTAVTTVALSQLPTSTRATIDFDSEMHYLDYDILVPAVIVTPDTPGIVSIVVNSGHWGDPGEVIGASFGISGLPTSCVMFWTADPSLIILGNLLSGQMVVQFPACQTLQSEQSIPILQLIIATSEPVTQHELHIVQGGTVNFYGPPSFLTCDPTPVEQSTAGGVLFLNPYTVGAEPTSWSTIKSLYRD